jgi:hypothetical protein
LERKALVDRNELFGHCALATDRAVDRMLHETRPDDFHERYIVGHCPLCPTMANVLARSSFREQIAAALEAWEGPR